MMTTLPFTRNTTFEVRLQSAFEHYLRALRERIAATIELKGTLPANFWTQEENALAMSLDGMRNGEIGMDDLAHSIISTTAPRVDELLAMESNLEISLDMLRYELRIGPLSDSRAERMAVQQASLVTFDKLSPRICFPSI